MDSPKSFAEILAETKQEPLVPRILDPRADNVIVAPDGEAFECLDALSEEQAATLCAAGVRTVIDDCGSHGYAGGLEWLEPNDPRQGVMPQIKLRKKHRTFARFEEWRALSGETLLCFSGPAFQWDAT